MAAHRACYPAVVADAAARGTQMDDAFCLRALKTVGIDAGT